MPPRWVVSCPECNHEFTYTLVGNLASGSLSRDPFASPPKPNVSGSGTDLRCNNCDKTTTYQTFDLRYRAE